MFIRLAWRSLLNRRGSVALTFLAISVSVFVLLGIEHVRQQTKFSFNNTVSGVDLIVGARTGDINLLLYSAFRLGSATNNVTWESYQKIAKKPKVAWTIPISLGDSHKSYRVMGTTIDYFKHFRYGQKKALGFTHGEAFSEVFDVVLGSVVARKLNYQLNDKLVLAHGIASTSFSLHDETPFRVVGILKPTGTPVDYTLHVSLSGIEAIHSDSALHDVTPKTITAFMVGLHSKMATFHMQREINNYRAEPLSAILPGVTLTQLWHMMTIMENTLILVSALVLLASLLGLSAMLLTSIRERQREIAIMRSLGAPPLFLFMLIQTEALLITLASSVFALLLLFVSLLCFQNFLADSFSLSISAYVLDKNILYLLLSIIISALVISLIPAISAYSTALQKTLNNV
jgi:putative ABC transport system permease protein